MKKGIFVILLFTIFVMNVNSEEKCLEANKEILCSIKLGENENINISIMGEDFNGFLGIAVNNNGDLIIPTSIKNSNVNNILYEYKNKQWAKSSNYKISCNSFKPISQDGLINIPGEIYIFNDDSKNIKYWDIVDSDMIPDRLKNNLYAVNKGVIIEKQAIRQKNKKMVALEIDDTKITKTYNDIDEINRWLLNQKSDFSIDADNFLIKKNDLIWTVCKGDNNGVFIGKTKNGFNVFEITNEEFYITDSTGVKVLSMPIKENKYYSYGIGTWGEIYMLLVPKLIKTDNESYSTEIGDKAELIVIRNHLKYFGILNDDCIRLRKGPGTDTESLGTYPVNTGFMILEDSGVKQTIGGVTKTWIKVRLLDGTEGYFFGQYVQNLYDGPGTPLPWPNVADWK